MLETSARLLRLLSLLQARRDWSGAELAERLGVGLRTVRRDVERLRTLGYPVHASTGVAGGYRLGAGTALPPLLLDDEEAVAVAVGLRSAAGGSVAGIEEASVRALTKLEQVLPPRLRHQVRALAGATVALIPAGPSVDPEVLTVIAAACRDRQRLRYAYQGAERTVEPYALVHAPRRWYLVAWDLDRDDWRTFRVDRIEGAPVPGHRFTPRTPPAEDMAAYVSHAVSSAPYRYQARILFHAPIDVVGEASSPTSGRLEPVDDKTCILHVGSNSLEDIAAYMALKGPEFEILDPPELIAYTRAMATRLAKAAGAPSAG